MVELYKEIDFSRELRDTPGLEVYLRAAATEAQEELTSDQLQKPFLDRSFDEFIIVAGLPSAEASKTDQFMAFFKAKILAHLEILDSISLIEFQLDEQKNFKGFAILKFVDAKAAQAGLAKLHGLKFAKYELSAFSLYSFQQVQQVPDEFTAPVNLPKKELLQWNQEGRKSLLVMHIGNKAFNFAVSHLESDPKNIFLKEHKDGAPEQNEDELYTKLTGENARLEWSENGTYLIEVLENGFQLYGGEGMQKLSFFTHRGIREVKFSPCENYILSYNGTIVDAPDEDNFIVWSVAEVKKLRVFKALQQDIFSSMKWSYDGKYIGKISDHKVSVFELPQMIMTNDSAGNPSSINIRNVQKFFWSNKHNVLIGCSYVGNLREHDKQVSTRISMFEIPSRREIKWRAINNESSDIEIVASKNGSFLIAIIKKIKNKKAFSHTIAVANIRNRGQLDISEVEVTEKVHAIFTDNTIGRVGLVYKTEDMRSGEASTMVFHSQIFQVEEENKSFTIKDAGRFDGKNTKEIMFSSNSNFFALINKDINSAHCGIMETGFTRKEKGKLISEITRTYNNLSYMNNAGFDSTGRYIFTSSQKTNSYQLWTAFGDQIFKDTVSDLAGLTNIVWRPRLTGLLDEKKTAEIEANLKNYKKNYEEEDSKITNFKEWENKERRERMKKEFLEYLAVKRQNWKETRQERIQVLGYDDEDDSDIVYDEHIENERVVKTELIEADDDAN